MEALIIDIIAATKQPSINEIKIRGVFFLKFKLEKKNERGNINQLSLVSIFEKPSKTIVE